MPRIVCLSLIATMLLTGLLFGSTPVASKGNATILSGDNLPYSIKLPFEDEAAFGFLELGGEWSSFPDAPAVLPDAPDVAGQMYLIESELWRVLLPEELSQVYAPSAIYYPASGVAEVRTAESTRGIWVSLDAGRTALLDRYIALGTAQVINSEPSIIDVLGASSTFGRSLTTVEVAGRQFDESETQEFWSAVVVAAWPEAQIPAAEIDIHFQPRVDVRFTGPDGRAYSMVYFPETDVLVPRPFPFASAIRAIPVPVDVNGPALFGGPSTPDPGAPAAGTASDRNDGQSLPPVIYGLGALAGALVLAVLSRRLFR